MPIMLMLHAFGLVRFMDIRVCHCITML